MVKKLFTPYFLIVGILLVLSLVLRFHRYAEFPVGGETRDEYAWTMLGASLIQEGEPISWSYFKSYKPFREMDLAGQNYPIVRPSLDHPPLFSLVPGLTHTLAGHSWEEAASLKVIRFPMIVLAGVNFILLAVYLHLLSDNKFKKLLALALFATVPTWVFGSRLVVSENVLTMWFLIVGICILKFMQYDQGLDKSFINKIVSLFQRKNKVFIKNQSVLLVIISLISALAILTKISGIMLPFTIILYALMQRKYKLAVAGTIGTCVGVILFMLYGYVYDWGIFVSIFTEQSARDIGLATLQNRFFLHPAVVNRLLVDGWMIVALFAIFAVHSGNSKNLLYSKIVTLSQLLFIALSVGEKTFHGWYVYSLFPFFAIFLSWWLHELFEQKKFVTFWLFWLFVLPVIKILQSHVPLDLSPLFIRLIILVGGIPLGLSILFPNNLKYAQKALLALVGVLLIINMFIVFNFEMTEYWIDDEYFLPKVVVK